MHMQVTRGDETGVRTVDTNRENETREVKPNTKTPRTTITKIKEEDRHN